MIVTEINIVVVKFMIMIMIFSLGLGWFTFIVDLIYHISDLKSVFFDELGNILEIIKKKAVETPDDSYYGYNYFFIGV